MLGRRSSSLGGVCDLWVSARLLPAWDACDSRRKDLQMALQGRGMRVEAMDKWTKVSSTLRRDSS